MSQGSCVPIPEEANALQSFMHNNDSCLPWPVFHVQDSLKSKFESQMSEDLRSIWEEFYSSTRDMWNPPVSVFHMHLSRCWAWALGAALVAIMCDTVFGGGVRGVEDAGQCFGTAQEGGRGLGTSAGERLPRST